MILTVTLNPLLERRISYKSIRYGFDNRGGSVELRAGGKGINVSRQLQFLGVPSLPLLFAGGNNGRQLKDVLFGEGLKPVLIRTESESREAFISFDESEKKLTTLFAHNQVITENEVNEFRSKMEKMISNSEIVVLSGSSPCTSTNTLFPEAIEMANRYDKISICDTYGDHLKDCINASPTILHNNIDEIKSSLGLSLNNQEEKLSFLDDLYSKNIKQVFITEGSDPFYASNFDFHYKVEIPRIDLADSTGSGDAFTAGIVYAWEKDLVYEDSLRLAVSLGCANASSYLTCAIHSGETEKYSGRVIISPVGKRMKIVNVTPQ
jgi:tagatose 6-phosphate kinase